jgi:ribosomal protein S18 acetylase RimI-like enzyme
MRVVVRRATTADAALLADLAARTFYDTFADSNTPEDMERFLSSTYSEEIQRKEIEDPSLTTLLVECDGAPAGFAQIKAGKTPACVKGPSPIEIKRFYVDKAFHGRGVAQELMGEAEEVGRAAGAKTIWLGVWEHNDRAIAFYRKIGFVPVGSQPFLVGTDLQTDLVLERPLQ